MKSYSLFEIDQDKVDSSRVFDSNSSNVDLLRFTHDEIDYISKSIETFRQDDEDIFNSIYRRSRLISGLSRINNFYDLHYILEFLVFCTDFLRHSMQKKSVKRIPHEIKYIINLIKNSSISVINEKIEGKESSIIFSDILEE